MSKIPMTWLELIKMKLGEEKKKGNSPSIRDVAPSAKKEWVQIKEGKHPKYTQGKAKTFTRKKKGNKTTKKNAKKNAKTSGDNEVPSVNENILSELKLCKKCKKTNEKTLKKKIMGNTCSKCNGSLVGGCGCNTPPAS